MRIFINNYNPNKITNILLSKKFNDHFRRHETRIEVFSEEGIYYIEKNNIYKLREINPINTKPIKVTNFFSNQPKNGIDTELIIDKSFYEKEEFNQIPLKHISRKMETFTYALSEKSNVEFVVKGIYLNREINLDEGNMANHYLINDKYKNFYVLDFYYNLKREMDIYDINLKDDIDFFFSLLK